LSLNLGPIRFSYRRFALFLFCLLWFSALAWWHRRVVMDDPWITFQYARNLVEGRGLVFNEGEPLEGYSNLSWVVASAAAIFARVEPLSFARLLSWLCGAAVFWALCMGWRREDSAVPAREVLEGPGSPPLPDDDPAPAHSATAALMLAATYPFAVWTMGGLETIFYAGLMFTLALARSWSVPSRTATALLVAAMVLLDVTRPEGFMWVVVVAAVAFFARDRRDALRHLLWAAGSFVLFHVLYTIWRIAEFGSWQPNTVKAKVGGSPFAAVLNGMDYLWSYFGSAPLLILVLAGMALWRARGDRREAGGLGGRARLAVVCGLVVGLQVLFVIAVGGDWMPAARFLVPVLPTLCVLAALALRPWPFFVRWVAIAFLLAAGFLQARSEQELRWCRWAAKEAGHPLLVQPLIETGEFLRATAPADATFAATEAGVMPYFSRLRFIDMLGLVDAHIASLPGGLHEKFDAEYILSRGPEFIVLGHTMTPTGPVGTWAPDQEMMASEAFAARYEIIHRVPRFMPPTDMKSLVPGYMAVYRLKGDGGAVEAAQ
jgi:hypothetical protein